MHHAFNTCQGTPTGYRWWTSDFEFVDDTGEGSITAWVVLDRIAWDAKAVDLEINNSETRFFTTSQDPTRIWVLLIK